MGLQGVWTHSVPEIGGVSWGRTPEERLLEICTETGSSPGLSQSAVGRWEEMARHRVSLGLQQWFSSDLLHSGASCTIDDRRAGQNS